MSDPLLESYEARPYRHGAIPFTHPARIAAIARLLGREPMPVRTARVLELGCGEGMNLLPLAERLPAGRFVGIDFSPQHIATAEEARSAAALNNTTLIQADLRQYEPEAGAFDYVIAHGVYSWVSSAVKDRLLALASKALAPGGIAYVSYNVYPGWGVIGTLRRIIRAHLSKVGDDEIEANLRSFLASLEQSVRASAGPFAQLAREAVAEMRSKPESLLFHDELGEHTDAVSFAEFVDHASKHGLEYLAEAHFAEMPWEHLPAGARAAFDLMHLDGMEQQGLLDLLGYRRFRSSLLVSGGSADQRAADSAKGSWATPDAGVIRECAIGFRMWPADSQVDLAPGVALRLVGANGFQVGLEKPSQKAFFAALCETAPARVPFTAAVARARELMQTVGINEAIDEEFLAKGVLKLFTVDQCDLVLSHDRDWICDELIAQQSALMRYQAAHGLPVVNRWHETVELNEDQRRFLAGELVTVDEQALRKTGLLF